MFLTKKASKRQTKRRGEMCHSRLGKSSVCPWTELIIEWSTNSSTNKKTLIHGSVSTIFVRVKIFHRCLLCFITI